MLLLLLAACPAPTDDPTQDSENPVDSIDDVCEPTAWWPDSDGDGYGIGNAVVACEAPVDHVDNDDDCDDADPTRNPGEIEDCDAVDQDCDGSIDEGHDVVTWYRDEDLDGYGTDDVVVEDCASPGESWSSADGDCNDGETDVNPGASETCGDGADNDCNGLADCEDATCVDGCTETDCLDEIDNDNDGDLDCFDDDCFGEGDCYERITSRVLEGSGVGIRLYDYVYGFYSPSGSRVVTSSSRTYSRQFGFVYGSARFQLKGWTTTCSWEQQVNNSVIPPQVVGACPVASSYGYFVIWNWLPEQHWTDSAFRLTDYRPWIQGPVTGSTTSAFTGTYNASSNYFRGQRNIRYSLSSVLTGSTFTHYPGG